MKVYDLTQTIFEDMCVYPGTEQPVLSPANTYEKDGFRETLLKLYSHTGTHIDAPAHIYPDGVTLDHMPPHAFCGSAAIIDCSDVEKNGRITMQALRANMPLIERAAFLLFRTGWDAYWNTAQYFLEYPCIDEAVAQYLIDTNKKGIGVDAISIDPVSDTGLTLHKKLLQSNSFIIIENLTGLHQLPSGLFTLYALPLKFSNADGAPARVIAIAK